jgi:hypothetical protein
MAVSSWLVYTERMSRVWRTIKGYLFWTYERGSFHYDVMVTVILLFIFVAPRFIDFKDQPAEHMSHPTGIVFSTEGNKLLYRVDASIVDAQDDSMVRANLRRVIEPISGKVTILDVKPVRDSSGHIVEYSATVLKDRRL